MIIALPLQEFLTAKGIQQMYISISDERNLAAAFVILEI